MKNKCTGFTWILAKILISVFSLLWLLSNNSNTLSDVFLISWSCELKMPVASTLTKCRSLGPCESNQHHERTYFTSKVRLPSNSAQWPLAVLQLNKRAFFCLWNCWRDISNRLIVALFVMMKFWSIVFFLYLCNFCRAKKRYRNIQQVYRLLMKPTLLIHSHLHCSGANFASGSYYFYIYARAQNLDGF